MECSLGFAEKGAADPMSLVDRMLDHATRTWPFEVSTSGSRCWHNRLAVSPGQVTKKSASISLAHVYGTVFHITCERKRTMFFFNSHAELACDWARSGGDVALWRCVCHSLSSFELWYFMARVFIIIVDTNWTLTVNLGSTPPFGLE